MRIRKISLAAALLLLAGSVEAQLPGKQWSLRECIDYAIENNISIKQQEVVVQDTELDLNSSKNSRLPNLTGSIGQSYGQSVSPITGGYETRRSASTSIEASSSATLYSGRRITHEIQFNELNLKAAVENLAKAKENLGLKVTSFYLDVLFKKELLKVAIEQVVLTSKQAERTKVLVESGKVPESQLYDIRAQLAQHEVSQVSAQNNLDVSLLDLAQLLNLPNTAGFDIREPESTNLLSRNNSGAYSPDDIYQTALGIKPHVREAEYLLESSEKNVKIAQGALYPTLGMSLNFGTGYTYRFYELYDSQKPPQRIPRTEFFDQLKDSRRVSAGLSLRIPVFNRFQTRNQVRSARLGVEKRTLELENVKQALYKEIQQAHQSAVAAESKFAATETAYEAAKLAYEYAEERYSVGKSTVFELNEAQNKLISSQAEQAQAKYDYVFRAKILDFYRGEPIDIR